jgi:hypothetical protein
MVVGDVRELYALHSMSFVTGHEGPMPVSALQACKASVPRPLEEVMAHGVDVDTGHKPALCLVLVSKHLHTYCSLETGT